MAGKKYNLSSKNCKLMAMKREENVSAGENVKRNVDHSRPGDLKMRSLDQKLHITWDLVRNANSKVPKETY